MIIFYLLPVPLMILNSCKEVLFFSSMNFFDKNMMFLLFIFPLVAYLILKSDFNFFHFAEVSWFYLAFFLVFLLLTLSFSSCSNFYFLMFMECTIILMILLIFNLSKGSDKIKSVFFMFFINIFGSLPFIFFSVAFPSCFMSSELLISSCNSSFILFCCMFLLFSKIPVIFLHIWLTKAHVSASGSGSMLLASVMLKIGTFGLFKVSPSMIFFSKDNFFLVLLVMTFFSIFTFSVIMIRFFDLKYLVACSSIVHMSFTPLCLLHVDYFGVYSSVLMMACHGLVSCFLFFLVTVLYEVSNSRSLEMSKNFESTDKSLLMILLFFFLMNLGLPPFSNFFSEVFLVMFMSSLSALLALFLVPLLILSGISFIIVALISMFGKASKNTLGKISSVYLCQDSLYYSAFLLFLPLLLC